MILVIGATGHFGRETVQALVDAGQRVRALSRTPESAGLPAEVEVVGGDLTRPSTLAPALADVTRMFVILPYGMDAAPLLQAATEAGVRRIAFLSSGAVVDGPAAQPDVIAAYHQGVEEAVRATGAEWTFLRLFFPAINSLSMAMQLKDGDIVRAPYGGATSAPVHELDVADVAAAVLTTDGHAGRVYELTGPESLTQAEQVRILGEALGRELRFEELDAGPVRQQMSRFMDGDFVNALFDLMEATAGKPAHIDGSVERITGRTPRTYAQWAADHVADFS
ncbi:SDR family oxidoreductase [Actinomadura sp. 21ATH]|uniref:SDR family oxidoreductase n=1 Tax=Actinomadura sp. 21ATH TaxID=1735444 RepID=UPI0035BFA211